MKDDGTVLGGGNRSTVVRVGDTVRRSTGPHSLAVHDLLIRLEDAGYPYSPRFLGVDGSGREVLSFLPGTVGNYPIPEAIRSLEAMKSALEIVRSLHDVTAGLRMLVGHSPSGAIPEVLCHWDAAPYNFVFDGAAAVGLIDFDEARPGRRIDDLAYFAYRFAPLSADENFADGGWPADTDRFERLHQIFELYPDERAAELAQILVDRLETMKRDPRTPEAHIEIYARDQDFIHHRSHKIAAAASQ